MVNALKKHLKQKHRPQRIHIVINFCSVVLPRINWLYMYVFLFVTDFNKRVFYLHAFYFLSVVLVWLQATVGKAYYHQPKIFISYYIIINIKAYTQPLKNIAHYIIWLGRHNILTYNLSAKIPKSTLFY